jgi:FMN phosphatase YigB (HAD superfamily)
MSKKIILFDIDRTIFDTDKPSMTRNEVILNILNNPPRDEFNSVKEEYKSTLKNEREYIPEDYIKMLCKKYNFKNVNALLDTYYGEKYNILYKNSVYPEFFSVVEKLKNEYRIGIFSEGYKRFRENRLKAMEIDRHLDDELIFMFDEKDTNEAVSNIPSSAIIVDDKERICDFLFEKNIDCIWLNRKDERRSDKYRTIHTLLELLDIL